MYEYNGSLGDFNWNIMGADTYYRRFKIPVGGKKYRSFYQILGSIFSTII